MTAIQRAYTAHCDRAELARSVAAIHMQAHQSLRLAAQNMREQGEHSAARWLDLCALVVDSTGAKHLRRLLKSSTTPSPRRCTVASTDEEASQTRPVVVQSVAPRDDDRAELLTRIEKWAACVDGYCKPGSQEHEKARQLLRDALVGCSQERLDAALRVMGAVK